MFASSPCKQNVYQQALEHRGISTVQFAPNDSAFDSYVADIQPDIVFFDRFMIEEQFGWRVRAHCPQALRVLDTCDLHSLRRLRQGKLRKGEDVHCLSDADLQTDDALREIAAILRSDLSLIISDAELDLLNHRYGIPEESLELCRFFYPEPLPSKNFHQRKHFAVIGNFNHAPNVDSIRVLHEGLWEKIRHRLHQQGVWDVELHVYGAYPTDAMLKLDNSSNGFRVLGKVEDAQTMFADYRVNLAPLRFGAGLKGKISDGWAAGTPCVATSIAAEGMHTSMACGGFVEDDHEKFADQAALLYSNAAIWQKASEQGKAILNEQFSLAKNSRDFLHAIDRAVSLKEDRRQRNHIGAMLWHQHNRSTEYFSRWIEMKNRID